MSHTATIKESEKGWLIEIPNDFADATGLPRNSIGLLQARDGKIEVEILPAPTAHLKEISERLGEKYQDFFAEMKQLGD